MNERIKELAEHAAEYAAQNATGDWEVGPAYQDLFNKKFAELIVQECAEIAYNKQYKHSSAHTRGDCAKAIKQHFGVEE